MPTPIDLRVDVSEAAGMPAELAATVFLPDPEVIAEPPVACFGFPGGGYGRRYYSFDMPDSSGPGQVDHGQAGWHSSRGWTFAAIDHLGVGDSTVPDTAIPNTALSFETVAAANHAAVEQITQALSDGTLVDGFPALTDVTTLGLGQSMGGCYTIVLQAHHRAFHGVGILGFSAIHTIVPARPGTPPLPLSWFARSGPPDTPTLLNPRDASEVADLDVEGGTDATGETGETPHEHPFTWAFHHDDVPASIVAVDLAAMVGEVDPLPEWRSATVPSSVALMLAPGVVASEAASITTPVLVAVGERDVVPNPWLEPFAYRSSPDVTLSVCPRMAHMHNFAGTRERFWRRIHLWGDGVARMRTNA